MSSKSRWFATAEKTESGWKWLIVEDVITIRVVGDISDDQFVPRDDVVGTSEVYAYVDGFLKGMRFTGLDLTPGKNEGSRIELFRNDCEATR